MAESLLNQSDRSTTDTDEEHASNTSDVRTNEDNTESSDLLVIEHKKEGCIKGNGRWESARKEILKLPFSKLKKRKCLRNILNTSPPSYGVKKLAAECEFSQDDINIIENGFCAFYCLDSIRQKYPKKPIERLKDALAKCELTKALGILNSFHDVNVTGDLKPKELLNLCGALTVSQQTGLPDWENLAEELNLDNIDAIKNCMPWDKAEQMMKFIDCKYTYISIGGFLKHAGAIENNLAKNEIEKQVDDLTEYYLKDGEEPVFADEFQRQLRIADIHDNQDTSLKDASLQLMRNTKKKLKNVILLDPVRDKSSKNKQTQLLHDEIIVNLALKTNTNNLFYLDHCERLTSLEKLKNQTEDVSLGEIIKTDDRYIVVNGIPGIGKTTLVKHMLYKWSCKELWSGKNGDITFDFVFVLYCRDLYKYKKNNDLKAKDLLLSQYPEIFNLININQLFAVKEKVLLIIDGFDEFSDLKTFNDIDRSAYCQSMYDILNPQNNEFPFYRLVTGRPVSCSILTETFKDQVKLKHLEVTGFTDENRRKYIYNFCRGSEELINFIETKIGEKETLKCMTYVPVFAWAVCSLLHEDQSIEMPETQTAIYAYLLLVFLRNHGERKVQKTFTDMLKDTNVKRCLQIVSRMAFITLKEGKIIFGKDDVETLDIDELEKVLNISGLITKNDGGDLDETYYQFTHLTLHEYLAAIHIFYNYELPIDFVKLINDQRFNGVVPYIAGLEGGILNDSKSEKVVKLFSKIWQRKDSHMNFESIGLSYGSVTNYPDFNFYCSDLTGFAYILFEYHNKLDEFSAAGMFNAQYNDCTPYVHNSIKFLLQNLYSWKKWYIDKFILDIHKTNVMKDLLPYICKSELIELSMFAEFSKDDYRSVCEYIPHMNKVKLFFSNYTYNWSMLSANIINAYQNNKLNLRSLEISGNGEYKTDFVPYIKAFTWMGSIGNLEKVVSTLIKENAVNLEDLKYAVEVPLDLNVFRQVTNKLLRVLKLLKRVEIALQVTVSYEAIVNNKESYDNGVKDLDKRCKELMDGINRSIMNGRMGKLTDFQIYLEDGTMYPTSWLGQH